MATDYPDAVDSLPRPTAATAMNASGFEGDVVIDNISDAIEAVETTLHGVYNVKNYGAAGDDSADDTAEIQAALTAAAAVQGTVLIPPGTYRISSALTVGAGVTVTGVGTIRQMTNNTAGLSVTTSGVTIEGITLQGTRSTAVFAGGEYAILAYGASTSSRVTDLSVRGVTAYGWGYGGVRAQFVDRLSVVDCYIHDVGYTGVELLSVAYGQVRGNRVEDVTPGSSGNMYGIALTHGGTYGASNPDTTDTVVDGNVVSGVNWEGIDTHGGLRITISNNVLLNCKDSISLNPTSSSSPKGISITGNVIDSLVDTEPYSGAGFSIHVTGASTSVRAQGVTITGNTLRRAPTMMIQNTYGTVITGNTFDTCCAYGAIWPYGYNTGFNITGNVFIDVWNSANWAACIAVNTTYNAGTIATNLLVDGPKTATYLNTYGLYNTGETGTDLVAVANDFRAAGTGLSGATGLTSLVPVT